MSIFCDSLPFLLPFLFPHDEHIWTHFPYINTHFITFQTHKIISFMGYFVSLFFSSCFKSSLWNTHEYYNESNLSAALIRWFCINLGHGKLVAGYLHLGPFLVSYCASMTPKTVFYPEVTLFKNEKALKSVFELKSLVLRPLTYCSWSYYWSEGIFKD